MTTTPDPASPSETHPLDMPCNVCDPDPHDEDCPWCGGTGRKPIPEEVLRVWEDFWHRLVVVDGRVDVGQVACELYDWHEAMSSVSTVYGEISGNRMSKPTYTADAVLGQYHEQLQRIREDWIEATIECLEDLPGEILERVREAME